MYQFDQWLLETAMDSDENIFLTKTCFKVSELAIETDELMSDVLDMEDCKPNFDLRTDLFSDISDENHGEKDSTLSLNMNDPVPQK